MIIIYRLEEIDNNSRFIEKGRWGNGEFTGGLKNYPKMTKEEAIDKFNRGYYRTSET